MAAFEILAPRCHVEPTGGIPETDLLKTSPTRLPAHAVPAVLALVAALTMPCAARAQPFDVNPGTWETTTTMSGNLVSPDMLAKLTPERRAMVEKMMADKGISGGKPTVGRSCVRKEDLDKDNFGRPPADNCTQTTTSRSPTRLVMETTCSGPPPLKGTVVIEAKTPRSVVGTIDQERADGSRFRIDMVGKWIGARCDAAAPNGAPR